MARTVAIGGTFALAASLAARSDPAHAAAHQACLQVRHAGSWGRGYGVVRSSILADLASLHPPPPLMLLHTRHAGVLTVNTCLS